MPKQFSSAATEKERESKTKTFLIRCMLKLNRIFIFFPVINVIVIRIPSYILRIFIIFISALYPFHRLSDRSIVNLAAIISLDFCNSCLVSCAYVRQVKNVEMNSEREPEREKENRFPFRRMLSRSQFHFNPCFSLVLRFERNIYDAHTSFILMYRIRRQKCLTSPHILFHFIIITITTTI